MPRVASPCIVFWTFLLLSFFLPVVDDDFFLGRRKLWGESRNLSRVMRRITSVKHHLKGGVQQKIIRLAPSPPPPSPQAINNDWSLTETFPRSMINKLLPQEPIRPHFLWVYQRNNLSDILGEHYLQAFLMSCSPNIPNGFFRRLTNRKWSLFLVYT